MSVAPFGLGRIWFECRYPNHVPRSRKEMTMRAPLNFLEYYARKDSQVPQADKPDF
jgi:hypothetical protein